MNKVNIVTSVKVSDDDEIRALIRAGTRVFRQNFSHGTNDEKAEQVEQIRRIAKEEHLEDEIKILQDLQGPKIRVGNIKDDYYGTQVGEELILDYAMKDAEHDGGNRIPLQYNLADKLHVGDKIFINDGKVHAIVTEIESETAFKIKVENKSFFKSKKGVNMIGADFGNDIFPEKDRLDMEFGASQGYDWVALSFIQNAENLREARRLMREYGYHENTKLVAKVETYEAIKNDTVIDEICREADIIMVARGDMAYEVGYEKVPAIQRKLIAACRNYDKGSIVATQTISSMEHNPSPTRAEVDNIAGAYTLGADYIMTSEETVLGKYPVETTATLREILDYSESNLEVISLSELNRITRFAPTFPKEC